MITLLLFSPGGAHITRHRFSEVRHRFSEVRFILPLDKIKNKVLFIDTPEHSLSRILDSFGADAAFASTAVSVRVHSYAHKLSL